MPANNPNSLCDSVEQLFGVSPSVSFGKHQVGCFAVKPKGFTLKKIFFNPCLVAERGRVEEDRTDPMLSRLVNGTSLPRSWSSLSISWKPNN